MSDSAYNAGHEAPASGRKYPEPGRRLRDAFERYLGLTPGPLDLHNDYDYSGTLDYFDRHAKNFLEDIMATPEEAHGLLLVRELKGKEKEIAGFFLSAVYNKSEAKEIVFDLETEVWNLAYSLANDKVFINRGNGYNRSGTRADGLVINYLENRKLGTIFAGSCGSGQIITYGADVVAHYHDDEDNYHSLMAPLCVSVLEQVEIRVNHRRIHLDGSSIHIDNRLSIDKDKHYSYLFVKEEIDKIPELRQYIDNLQGKFEQGRRDYHTVIETIRGLGPQPHEKIKQDIVDILRRAGRNV